MKNSHGIPQTEYPIRHNLYLHGISHFGLLRILFVTCVIAVSWLSTVWRSVSRAFLHTALLSIDSLSTSVRRYLIKVFGDICCDLEKSIMHPTTQNHFPQLKKYKAKTFASCKRKKKYLSSIGKHIYQFQLDTTSLE